MGEMSILVKICLTNSCRSMLEYLSAQSGRDYIVIQRGVEINMHIKSFIEQYGISGLEFVYCVFDGTEIEHHFLAHTQDQFIWNVKQSEEGAWRKYLRAL